MDDHKNGLSTESEENRFNVQVVNTLPSGATRSCRGIQSLREMFPTKSDNELTQALDVSESLEEAINLLVEVQETSVNDLY